MKRLAGGSAYSGKLSPGCTMCAKGAKMVLFISGICDAKCFYCPLSENRKMNDVMYADEMPISGVKEAILEANMINASGTGITGGDPMKYYERTSEYIRALKAEFGDKHHIHLYTISGSEIGIKKVAEAGLDEIRFHPPEEIWHMMDRTIFKDRIKWARSAGLDVGIEVPSLPGREKETELLIQFAEQMDLDFVNLNELEFSETNYTALLGRGIQIRSDTSSGAKQSRELAIEMVKTFPEYAVHYCSASFKDGIQLRNRLKRRASNIARSIDVVTKDGTILKGVIQGENISVIRDSLLSLGIPDDMIFVNDVKKRVEVPSWILDRLPKENGWEIYQVEEYPTWDAIEVERLRI
jgi:hypothetical protein